MNNFLSKLLGLAGFKVIKGSELDKMLYQIKHKTQTKHDNYLNPIEFKKLLLKDIKSPVIFDAGAYIGTTAIEYAKQFPNGLIYAFEPTLNTFEQLRNNCFNIKNINLFNIALSDKDGKVNFYVNEFSPTNSILDTDSSANEYWGENLIKTKKIVSVKSIRLDTFCHDVKVSKIDLLKLDVQGAEIRVLNGASNLIDDGLIKCIYAEVLFVPTYEHQTTYYEIGQYLSKSGYYLHSLYNLAYDDNRLKQADLLYLRG
jgi:FkbM family methyltransferase